MSGRPGATSTDGTCCSGVTILPELEASRALNNREGQGRSEALLLLCTTTLRCGEEVYREDGLVEWVQKGKLL
eukprot:scaffold264609_cov22-Tisochrysis_lutea.AAC.1